MGLIYVVEDEESIREIEVISLKNIGYDVVGLENANQLYKQLEKQTPDLVLLDVMLPDENGLSIAKKLRLLSKTNSIPIIMVTAKTTEMDMIRGLDIGADDYIKKPFSIIELQTRVRAMLRRNERTGNNVLFLDEIKMDLEKRVCLANNKEVELTYKEFELLSYLLINKNIVLSRDAIMNSIWGYDYEAESRTIDMHIKSIRQKLGDSGEHIKTVRNVGYVAK